MSDWAIILLVFTAVAAVVTLVAVLVHSQVRASIKLPGRAEFYIDARRGGWQVERRRSFGSSHRPSTSRLRYYLEMKLRNGPNWIYPLDGRTQVHIGRHADSDLVLLDSTADTRQAVIYRERSRFKIANLSKRTATLVNGRPITKQNLGDGNTIQMGRTKLIFRDASKRRPLRVMR